MGDIQFNGTQEDWIDLINKNKIMTALDWFKQQISTCELNEIDDNINAWFEEAKRIEREQIMEAFSNGQETPINHPTLPHYSRDEYYNQTYKL